MNRITKFSKMIFATVFIFTTLFNANFFKIDSAKADGCLLDPSLYKLAIYSDTGIDPQLIPINAVSGKYWVQIQDLSNTPTASDCTTYVALSFSLSSVNEVSSSGVLGDNKTTISKGNTRASFYLSGSESGTVTITAATTTGASTPSQQLQPGTQSAIIGYSSPDKNLLTFTNNIHGIADTISGKANSVLAGIVLPGIKVRAYSDIAGTLQLGADAVVGVDGSFTSINIGDDLYRNITLRAVYPSDPPILSDAILIGEPVITYPALITGVKVQHSIEETPYITWDDAGVGVRYVIFRKNYSSQIPFNDSNIITTISDNSFQDDTAVFGERYLYLIKQVIDGSYTPEFLPIVSVKLDIGATSITPTNYMNIASNYPTPYLTANISSDLMASQEKWLSDPSNTNISQAPLTLVYTNHNSGLKYFVGYGFGEKGNLITDTHPYKIVDSNNVPYDRIVDGAYTVEIVGIDQVLGINDKVVVSSNYVIDTIAPEVPVLGKLRYENNTLSGVVGAAEPGTHLYVYDFNGVKLNTEDVVIAVDGSFNAQNINVPTSGVFYLSLHDNVGNSSSLVTFDVMTIPSAPLVNKITMVQNQPGTNDVITALPGAVSGGITIKIYTSDPLSNPEAVPFRILIANADGSFSQEVGDNLSANFWIVAWSGSGKFSSALKLLNTISSSAVTGFVAIAGDSKVSLSWNHVLESSYYKIDVYDISANLQVTVLSVLAGQNSLQLSLTNGHNYRFTITSYDKYGNVSNGNTVYATPASATVVLASAKTTIYAKPSSSSYTSASSKISEIGLPAPSETKEAASTNSAPISENNRNWAPWILAIGILILLVAGCVAYLLWGKQNDVVVTETKPKKVETGVVEEAIGIASVQKTAETKSSKTNANIPKKPKPRW